VVGIRGGWHATAALRRADGWAFCWRLLSAVGSLPQMLAVRGACVLCCAVPSLCVPWCGRGKHGRGRRQGKGGDVMLRQRGTIGFLGRPLLQEKKVIITSIECSS
jgi:hypothetical protein